MSVVIYQLTYEFFDQCHDVTRFLLIKSRIMKICNRKRQTPAETEVKIYFDLCNLALRIAAPSPGNVKFFLKKNSYLTPVCNRKVIIDLRNIELVPL